MNEYKLCEFCTISPTIAVCALKIGAASPLRRKIKTKSKVKVIVRHLSQQKSLLITGQPTLGNTRTYDSSDIILAFINSDEEDANERPNATR